MKTITKIFSLVLVLTLSVAILAGCAVDELTLLSALAKQTQITSCESKTNVAFSLTADGLKESEKQKFDQIASVLNGMKLEVNQKVKSNAQKTVTKAQADINLNMSGINTSASVWVDSDLTGEVPKLKEIFKFPSLLTMSMSSENRGKEYMVMDMADMMKSQDSAAFNNSYRELLKYSTELSPKLINFLKDFAKNSNPGFSIVTSKGSQTIDGQYISTYNLKLDDATFKKLLSYTVSNFVQSESSMNFVKDIFMNSIDMSGLSYMERMKAKGEVNKSFDKFKTELPEFLKSWDNIMTCLKDVKILGDKGIDISFGINSDGYIVNVSGTCDFVINPKAYKDAFETYSALEDPDYIKEDNEYEGIIGFTVNFNTVVTKINREVAVDIPVLTPENSYSFKDMYNSGRNFEDTYIDEDYEEDTIPPAAPAVNKVLKASKAVTGKAEAFSIITVKKGDTVIGDGLTDEKGAYSITITPVNTNCTLKVTATDLSGNESKATTVKVDK